jgi:isoamylase
LLLSQGTPMMLAGDELGRTQNGNNNVYGQDNELNWIDWTAVTSDGRRLLEFSRKLIALRKAYPMLRRGRYLVGQHNAELDVKDLAWLSPAGTEIAEDQWNDGRAKCFGMLLDGRAQPTGIKQRGSDATLLIVFNAHHDVVKFTLPEVPEGKRWTRLIDTNLPAGFDTPNFDFNSEYDVTGRSLLLFVLNVENQRARSTRTGFGAVLDIIETPMEGEV